MNDKAGKSWWCSLTIVSETYRRGSDPEGDMRSDDFREPGDEKRFLLPTLESRLRRDTAANMESLLTVPYGTPVRARRLARHLDSSNFVALRNFSIATHIVGEDILRGDWLPYRRVEKQETGDQLRSGSLLSLDRHDVSSVC